MLCALAHRLREVLSLFLAATSSIFLLFAGNHLAKHNDTVTIHEGYAREPLAVFEGVTDERLLWLKAAFGHLVRFERVRIFHFFAASFLAHLPNDFGNTACRTATAHEANGRVAECS